MRTDESDAATLRAAAWVLHTRSEKQTFALRVVIRTLRRAANRIDGGKGEPG